MEDLTWIDELDGVRAADALVAAGARLVQAEAEQFRLAAQWVDLHAPAWVAHEERRLDGPADRGRERLVAIGADGTPEVAEYATAELGALLGRSTRGGQQLAADAVNVRHRHPLLWAGVMAGTVRVWVATKVARRCAAAGLSREQAAWVDTETTPYLATLPVGRFLDLVEAKIVAADPDAAAERVRQEALKRYVHAGRADEHGLRTFVARARSGDVLHLVAVVDRLAAILLEQGVVGTRDERRATALRLLANPARALALLLGAEPAGSHEAPEQLVLPLTAPEGHAVDLAVREPEPEPTTGPAPQPGLDPADLAALRDALRGPLATRLDPLMVFHVHVDSETLAEGQGLARVEHVGPVTLAELRAWLGEALAPTRVHVRPVLDAARSVSVDRYEITGAVREVMLEQNPYEVFPWGTLPSRRADGDHARPYQAQGPPDQTSTENSAPLSRLHHRLKTNGRWTLRHPRPGHYFWRSPHGHWFHVSARGSVHLGRSAELDATAGRGDPEYLLASAG